MSEIVYNPNVTEDAKKRLLEQYQGEQDPEALITIVGTQAQHIEDAIFQLKTLRNINTATGAQLDTLGAIVGFARNTSNDDIYRLEIRAKIVKNVSQGEAERLIAVYLFMTEATVVDYSVQYPGGVMMMSDGVIPPALTDGNLIYSLVSSTAGAGIKIGALGLFDPATPFGFAGPMGIARGYASLAQPTQGGKFGHLLKEKYPFGYGSKNKTIRGFGTISLNEPNMGGKYVGL